MGSVDRAPANDDADYLEGEGSGNEDEPSDRLSKRGREGRNRDREVDGDRRHDQGQKDDLRTQARGPRTTFLVQTPVEREAIADGRDEDSRAVVRQSRGDAHRERFERDP